MEETKTPLEEAAAMQGPPPAMIAKVTLLTPAAVNVVKLDGPGGTTYKLEFLITPFEVVAVQFDSDAKDGIVRELTGGVTIAKPGDVAGLRG